ncbi:hypothetical protein [Croceibacterium ferulae]|uniref:hypothetical protein n=1 Tax=Croceibacterium ferulae TaxID=1854641 RepID=UPI000EB2482F|nr:hypothetical protein [Croceibacterium ferulae]
MTDELRPSTICGLLYCGDIGERHTNMADSGGDPLLIYVQNAATLARSLAAHEQALTLVTNDAMRVGGLVEQAGATGLIAVEEVAFTLEVPRGIPFYSAHFKLELLRLFGEGRFGAFPALLDLDVVALRPLAFPPRPGLWAYDIAHEMLDGSGGAVASLQDLAGVPLQSRSWFGGEFLAGPQAEFARLWQMVEELWPDYCNSAGEWYHSGDEMVVSAALNRLVDDGMTVNDAGRAGLVSRWWSVRTTRRLGRLADAQQCAILHLPADKHLLARHSTRPFAADAFVTDLRADVKGRDSILRTIAHNLKGRRFAPLLD